MKKLSAFDLGVIIAFAVITLLGGGAWWYLSGNLQDAQSAVAAAKADYDKYSTKSNIVVSPSNGKMLESSIAVLQAQLGPLIQAKLQPKENTLHSVTKQDPVAWKHDLEEMRQRLNTLGKVHSVTLPGNSYYAFSRYQSSSPRDDQTPVLSKQLIGVEQLVSILMNASVKDIKSIRRTYEEDPSVTGTNQVTTGTDSDHLPGYSFTAPGNAYTSYPFEVEFDTTTENLRTILNNCIASPYLFIVRTIKVQNSVLTSPQITDLDKIIGTPAPSVVGSSPGEVASTTSTKGPQFLFGNSTIKIKARIDMIEWTATVDDANTDKHK